MKIKEILEGEVVDMDAFKSGRSPQRIPQSPPEDDMDVDDVSLGPRDPRADDSPDLLDNEMDKRRYLQLLQNRSGHIINDVDLVKYLRERVTDRKAFNRFVGILLTKKEHLYNIVQHVNQLLSKSGSDERVVGVSPNAEDWYFK
jgi:hypothetical protein